MNSIVQSIAARLVLYWQLTRFNKPIGIMLLLWPTLTALWLASYGQPDWPDSPDWHLVVIFTLGTALMRAAGCAINDYADRDFDKHVKRTAQRPLTSGKINGWEAVLVAMVLALVSFGLITPLNQLTKMLALVAVVIAASYPYFKRFFSLPQAYLGIAFGMGIPMAYAAVQNHIPHIAWLLLLGNIFWAIAYDTEYAMVDKDDDVKLGIHTSAITFGNWDIPAIVLCYCGHLTITAWVGWWYGLGLWFFLGVSMAALCAVYHVFLIRDRLRERCFKAFVHNNWLGCCIFIGLVLDFALK